MKRTAQLISKVGGVASPEPHELFPVANFTKFQFLAGDCENCLALGFFGEISDHCSSAIRPDNHVSKSLSLSGRLQTSFIFLVPATSFLN